MSLGETETTPQEYNAAGMLPAATPLTTTAAQLSQARQGQP